jgi:hypothetical protein
MASNETTKVRIEMFEMVQRIEADPPSEPKYVHPNKGHSATKVGKYWVFTFMVVLALLALMAVPISVCVL